MARFARAAVDGGAIGIRANSPQDVRAIRAAVDVPIVAIEKRLMPDGQILITPTFEDAAKLVEAGAAAVALDCTARGQRHGALDRLRQIREQLGVPVFADIATESEALAAQDAGADFVLSTMRGYTEETAHIRAFQPGFIEALTSRLTVPVIAEGQIVSPEEAAAALQAGAWAVIVGTAITRPHEITRRFAAALRKPAGLAVGIDLGGTNTKSGLVTAEGTLLDSAVTPTPTRGSQREVLDHLAAIAHRWIAQAPQPVVRIGIATGGWLDSETGAIVYATGTMPSWNGAPIRPFLQQATGLPVSVENDANALAVAEWRYGAGRGADPLVCLTLGTGVGGGCIVGGRLRRGANGLANALGHLTVVPSGRPCTCGRNGCLEVYANAAALARDGIESAAAHLAAGCAQIVHVLDPGMIVLGGGGAEQHPGLAQQVEARLAEAIIASGCRRVPVVSASLGYTAGV